VQRLAELERAAGLAPGTEVWVKRDDLSGEPYGTSKVRKLELVFGDAIAQGFEHVVTIGPFGSNHALATAIYAERLGLGCRLELWPEPVDEVVRERLCVEVGLGAEIRVLGGVDDRALADPARPTSVDAERSYFVPPAGTDPVGATGYVECGLELTRQVRTGEMPRPDAVLTAGGTGGVAAGLAVGFALGGEAMATIPVTAVRAVSRAVLSVPRMRILASRVVDRLARFGGEVGAVVRPGAGAFSILHAHAGAGYGAATADGGEAARLFQEAEGLKLDPVYTAKAAAGMLAYARGEGAGTRLLFLHTYGERDLGHLAADPAKLPPAVRSFLS
jgi:D-cysteine desulfhydrase